MPEKLRRLTSSSDSVSVFCEHWIDSLAALNDDVAMNNTEMGVPLKDVILSKRPDILQAIS